MTEVLGSLLLSENVSLSLSRKQHSSSSLSIAWKKAGDCLIIHVSKKKNLHFPACHQGPFATFKLQYDRTCEWTGLKFSNDGKLILLSTNGGALRILDAFKGAVLHSFGVRDKFPSCRSTFIVYPAKKMQHS